MTCQQIQQPSHHKEISVVPKSDVVKMLHPQVPQPKESIAFVSTDEDPIGARRSVKEVACVSINEDAVGAKSVEEAASASMGGSIVNAWSAEGSSICQHGRVKHNQCQALKGL